MANRQTKRERKALAKQRKLEEAKRAARRRRLQKVYSLITALVVVAGIAGLVWLGGRQDRNRVAAINSLAAPASCNDIVKPQNKGAEHIVHPARGEFSSKPPTSGSHYASGAPGPGQGPVATGVRNEPIPDEGQVHNLEHGHMGIQYLPDKLPAAVKTELEKFASDAKNNQWVFMAPYPGMDKALTFSVWDHLLTCDTPTDAKAILAVAQKIRDTYVDQNRAPENFPGTPTGTQPSHGGTPPASPTPSP